MVQGQCKVLLFEKDENIGSVLQEFLQMMNISSMRFSGYEEAYRSFCKDSYNVCLISLDDFSEDGFTLGRKLRAIRDNFVLIFMGAHPSIEEIKKAYEAGADDFVRKPFILEELHMRVLAILKRTHGLKWNENRIIRIGRYTFDTQKRELVIDGKLTKLTNKEADLLKCMCTNINLLTEREEVLKNVWKNDSFSNARSMDVYITKLRRLLQEDGNITIINVHGRGYKLLIDQ